MKQTEVDLLTAGPELDRLVAEKVMGWRYHCAEPTCTFLTTNGTDALYDIPAFSADVTAATTLFPVFTAKKMPIWVEIDPAHHYGSVDIGSPTTYKEDLQESFGGHTIYGASECVWEYGQTFTPPMLALAICKAALKAVEKEAAA